MNQDTFKGQWRQLRGTLRQQWGKLTEDDLAVAEGDLDYLVGRVQERYGLARAVAEREVAAFGQSLRQP